MNRYTRLFLPAVLLLLPIGLIGQTVAGVELFRLGGGVGGSLLDYDASFSSLPGVPSCCPGYEDGGGTSFDLGVGFEVPLIERFRLLSRLRFTLTSGELEAEESALIRSGDDTLRARFLHTIELDQPALQIEELIGFAPLRSIRILGGVRLDLMIGGDFHQREEILSPEDIRYENDLRTRMTYEGDIPEESGVGISLVGGVTGDIVLNRDRTLIIAPEILYAYGMSDLISSRSLRSSGLRIGLNLMWVNRTRERAPSPLEPGIYLPVE